MKKIILSICSLATLISFITTAPNKVSAEETNTDDIVYKDNAYQMCDVQSTTKNLYLGDSIYNYAPGNIRQSKSIRVSKTDTNFLTFYFKFNKKFSEYNFSQGEFKLTLFNENLDTIINYAQQVSSLSELENLIERDERAICAITENEIFIQMKIGEVEGDIIIAGDEHINTSDHFSLMLGRDPLLIERFMLYDGLINDFNYVAPQYGLGKQSDKVYLNGETVTYTINYDNRPSLDKITEGIIAYDFYDKTTLSPSVEIDEYTNAINENKLGTFSVKLKATDSSNNSSNLNLYLSIKDMTAPAIKGSSYIEIHYTDLPEGNIINLSDYITVEDNYDGEIALDEKYNNYSVKYFSSEKLNITLSDSSGNVGGGTVYINITDMVSPEIIGPEKIEAYQFQYSSIEELLDLYEITDVGSGIKEYKILSSYYSLTKPGKYYLEVFAEDNAGNTNSQYVELVIKDGVGPVFFVNLSSITLTTDTYQSAQQVITTLMEKGDIVSTKYTKCEYITTAYKNNYNKVGKYDTQIICYQEDGSRDYYLVNINVTSPKNSNFFTRFYDSMINFFKKFIEFCKTTWEKIVAFFKN